MFSLISTTTPRCFSSPNSLAQVMSDTYYDFFLTFYLSHLFSVLLLLLIKLSFPGMPVWRYVWGSSLPLSLTRSHHSLTSEQVVTTPLFMLYLLNSSEIRPLVLTTSSPTPCWVSPGAVCFQEGMVWAHLWYPLPFKLGTVAEKRSEETQYLDDTCKVSGASQGLKQKHIPTWDWEAVEQGNKCKTLEEFILNTEAFPVQTRQGLVWACSSAPSWLWQCPPAPRTVGFIYPVMTEIGSLTTALHTALPGGCTSATQEPQIGHWFRWISTDSNSLNTANVLNVNSDSSKPVNNETFASINLTVCVLHLFSLLFAFLRYRLCCLLCFQRAQ